MKKVILLLIVLSIFLSWCADRDTIESEINFTNGRVNDLYNRIGTEKNNRELDISDLKQRVFNLETKVWLLWAAEKMDCVWFMPKVGMKVYADISDDIADNDAFREAQWTIHEKPLRYVEVEVQSYSVEWDCVTHINQLWPSWKKSVQDLLK